MADKRSRIPFLSAQTASYFVAGGIAGAASRTVVQPTGPNSAYQGVWASLVKMWREEGWRGMMAGNGINCLRIVPYSAVQFTTYEKLKKVRLACWFCTRLSHQLLTANGSPLDTPTRLLAGALAGITSVTTTYPLDLIRSRLSIASASIRVPPPTSAAPPRLTRAMSTLLQHPSPIPGQPAPPRAPVPSMWGMALKVMREEGGIRGLYRCVARHFPARLTPRSGLVPTAVGVAPYVGINFASYERLRQIITPDPSVEYSIPRKLLCGALAGSISQTLTYPFDVLRRKMQVVGMQSGVLGYKYNGAIDALRTIVRVEGAAGLYRGLWPNLHFSAQTLFQSCDFERYDISTTTMAPEITIHQPDSFHPSFSRDEFDVDGFMGKWYVVWSTLPLWKSRTDVTITYAPISNPDPNAPLKFDDTVEYRSSPGAAPSQIVGVDTLADTPPPGAPAGYRPASVYNWRGRGWQVAFHQPTNQPTKN
ncbi:mitochondrial carrier [Ceratobasidium theobromae]|uniref:Mitochondrial carrier n=1 Tax=Ceratobasidium theobromae TaxID=1582974 RepID=A0A5N5QEE2_9AGAM|nr:mitochondrial carrier [Ceratobasidium theobromae]